MRPLLRSLAVVVVAVAVAAGPALAGTRVAVVTLDAPAQLQNTGRGVAEAFAKRATAAGYEVLGPATVEQKLGKGAYAALVRCGDDARCLADRGAKLGVDLIVAGTLLKAGTSYRVAVVSANAITGARLGGLEREIAVASRRLQKDVADAAPALLEGGKDATGVLRVTTDAPGAAVTIDDAPAGRTPVAKVVKPGRHKVHVALRGYADAEASWVDVPASAIVEHRPRLYAIPARDRPNASASEGQGTAVQIVK
jgi:hypothetical protein